MFRSIWEIEGILRTKSLAIAGTKTRGAKVRAMAGAKVTSFIKNDIQCQNSGKKVL